MTLLKILIVDDSKERVALLMRELSHAGYETVQECVDTPVALIAALDSERCDVLVWSADFSHFNMSETFQLIKEKGMDIPFIVGAGIRNYLIKKDAGDLSSVIERESRELQEKNFEKSFLQSSESILRARQDGVIEYTNKTGASLMEYWGSEEKPEETPRRHMETSISFLVGMNVTEKNVLDFVIEEKINSSLREIASPLNVIRSAFHHLRKEFPKDSLSKLNDVMEMVDLSINRILFLTTNMMELLRREPVKDRNASCN